MKKLLFFLGFVLCGLLANAQIPGIESYSSENADTIYDNGSKIFIEYTNKWCADDSIIFNIVFDVVESYTISESFEQYLGNRFESYKGKVYFQIHSNVESFSIKGKTTGRVYEFEPVLKPIIVDDLSWYSNTSDTIIFCSLFRSSEIFPRYNKESVVRSSYYDEPLFLNDPYSYFVINNKPIKEKLTSDLNLKEGDILRIERTKSEQLNINGCLLKQLEDTLKSPNYYIKYQKNVVFNNGLAITKGDSIICPGDTVEIKKFSSGGSWVKNNSSFKFWNNSGDILKVNSPGLYAYIFSSGICPSVSLPLIKIKSDVNCLGLISGVVKDFETKQLQPGVLISTNTGLTTVTDQLGTYFFKDDYNSINNISEVFIADKRYYYGSLDVDFYDTFRFNPNLDLYALRKTENDLYSTLNSTQNRPGFTIPYYVSLHNRGKNPLTTNVAVNLDGNLTYTSKSGENKPTTASGQTLTWDNITVESGATKRLTFYATLDRLTPLGTELVSTAELMMATPDDVPENDKTTFKTIVSGSFDPNDKLVTYAGAYTEGYVYDTTSFEYTIRFQNTGTDTAFTVRIEDVISKNLDLTTINFIDASHEFTPSISGDTVKWLFENILLADSNTNEPASHGFVRFSIEQKPGNLSGTEIRNKAAIYFDFNDPVITNEIVSTVNNDIVTELKHEISYQTQGIVSAYPNPARTSISINAEGNGIFELYNATGSQVLKTREKENIHIESLKSGVYYYQFITNEKTFSGSFVKE